MKRARWRSSISLLLGICLLVVACTHPTGRAPTPSASGVRSPIPLTPAPTRSPGPTPSSSPSSCPIFPADSIWNRDISQLPVDPSSDRYIASIGAQGALHPDFGTDPSYGIPYNVVPDSPPRVPVSFDYSDESDPGPYPIPAQPIIEQGSDAHLLIVDEQDCHLYELYAAQHNANGSWHAGSGAIWDLRSNALRPAGWTSADAAGLPILPGLVRYDEVAAGAIRHALRFTVQHTRNTYIWPARHQASDSSDPSYPPMGLRMRLKASVDVSGFPPADQVILTALKRYGMLLADNGSNWYLTGAPDSRWDDDALNHLKTIPGSDFEVVDTSSLMLSPDSGQARQP